MASERQERVRVERGDGFERRQRVVEVTPSARTVFVSRVSRFLWLLATVVTVLIGIRFVLKLIAANPTNTFADLIYSITDVLVAPFVGLINTPAAANGAVFDVPALFAIVIYLLATWALVQLFRILFASTNSTRRVTTVERARRD
ncbi:MAG: hypothetical protein SF029_08525 [bacterium]|nr:hypothetical protein [bacterium]